MGVVMKDITFENLDGETVTEQWYFSLDEEDASDMDYAHNEDATGYLTAMMKAPKEHTKELIKLMKEMIFHSVARREGMLLVKDDEVRRQFRYGGAYKQLWAEEVLEAEDGGLSFFNSIMPAKVQAKYAEEKNKTYSKEDMLGMTINEFEATFGDDETSYTPEQLLVAFQLKTHQRAA